MTNPTSNFGWQMPTPTDLVTDLPADFEVFGQAVDTSMADLKGGTTGQILSKATNTDMDFTWITNDVGDITAVTAGTGITGGGTSGAVTITNSMATAIDAKGDLIAGTAADTFARLPIGTNGQILAADSAAATGLTWITNDVGDITAVTVTAPITGGGTSGSVGIAISAASTAASGAVQLSDSTSTTSSVLAATPTAVKAAYDLANTANTTANAATPKSTFTAKGSIAAATAASTPANLAVGTNGQTLFADSTAATGLKWNTPSGMTLISTTTLSGATTTISSIPQIYKSLQAVIIGVTNATADGILSIQPNANNNLCFWGGTNYAQLAGTTSNIGSGFTTIKSGTTNMGRTSALNSFTLKIDNYTNDPTLKPFQLYGGFYSTDYNAVTLSGYSVDTQAIVQLVFSNSGGNFLTGTVLLYGVN